MLPIVLQKKYREDTGVTIEYKPYQFLPFAKIFDKKENGFALKENVNRLRINDDHGVGLKTETGIIISELLHNDPDLRVAILTYKENAAIWKKQMYEQFGLDFHIYGENGKTDSDLLIVNYDKSNVPLDEFDVQVVYGLNYYEKPNVWDKIQSSLKSNPDPLRIFIHSDKWLDNAEKEKIPETTTSLFTVSGFKINNMEVKECESQDKKLEVLNNGSFYKAVIFAKSDKSIEELKNYDGITKNRNEAAEFQKSEEMGSALICTLPFGLDLSNCDCDDVFFYDIFGPKSEIKSIGSVCKANRTSNVNIVYLVDKSNEDAVNKRIEDYEAKQARRQADCEEICREVEKFLGMTVDEINREIKPAESGKGEQK